MKVNAKNENFASDNCVKSPIVNSFRKFLLWLWSKYLSWICIFQNFQSPKGSSTGKLCLINVKVSSNQQKSQNLFGLWKCTRLNHKFHTLQHSFVFTWNAVLWKVDIYLRSAFHASSLLIQIFQKLNPNPNSSGIKYTKVGIFIFKT